MLLQDLLTGHYCHIMLACNANVEYTYMQYSIFLNKIKIFMYCVVQLAFLLVGIHHFFLHVIIKTRLVIGERL